MYRAQTKFAQENHCLRNLKGSSGRFLFSVYFTNINFIQLNEREISQQYLLILIIYLYELDINLQSGSNLFDHFVAFNI